MKVIVAVTLLLAVAGAMAQNATVPSPEVSPVVESPALESPAVSPEPAVEASPAVMESPAVEASPAVMESPAVEASPAVMESPAVEESPAVADNATSPPAANITDSRVAAYFSSPLFAIQSVPQLSGLAGLVKESSLGSVLANKRLSSTIFAPSNEAVEAAAALLQENNITITQPVVDDILKYHVAGGANLVLSRLRDGQELVMLDKNTTTITIENGTAARRMLLQDNATYFISSDSDQKFQITGGNIQGGSSQIHIIDGVLLPKKFTDAYGLTAGTPSAVDNGTVDSQAVTVQPGEAPAPSPSPAPPKSAAGTAVVSFLAVPALLAMLMM